MKYEIIYADPPWPEQGGGKIKRGADKHYKLMTVRQIKALPVQFITADDAHLYLWTTNNYLHDALHVMEAWGFRYVTMITWMKNKIGLGQYFRGITEPCLFGIKGNIPYKSEFGKRCQGRTGFEEAKTTHSKKPRTMREMIEHVSDRKGFKKIELFATERFQGWDVTFSDFKYS